ncbi:MAG: putative metal-binding motif-containing protein [Myxococcota bacterium]
MRTSSLLALLLALGCRPEGPAAPEDTGEIEPGPTCDKLVWYTDADADGYGNPGSFHRECTAPAGTVADAGDCDDTNAAVSPDGIEVCNTVDDNCDGTVDEDAAVGAATWHADTDGDGYGDPGSALVACDTPAGAVVDDTDCDDTSAAVSPGGEEVCNTIDDNCDGTVDEESAADASTWYADIDGDGYGDAAAASTACDAPARAVADATDCDDTDAAVSPGGEEVCNTMDDDCDAVVDEDDAVDAPSWYADADGDGFGDPAVATVACTAPARTVADATDCNDDDAAVSPAAAEVCNDRDDDCDGTVDLGAIDTSPWYADADSDGFGDASALSTELACDAPSGHVADDTDCDDLSAAIHPDADDPCDDGVDDDCDGADDGCAATEISLATADVQIDADRYTNGQAGYAVAAGDTDGDGLVDLAIGAPSPDGEVRLARGPVTSGVLSDATMVMDAGWYEGMGVALALGDFDGDGLDDIAGGGPGGYYSSGYVAIYSASGTYVASMGTPAWWLAAGDVTGDGADDLLVSGRDVYDPVTMTWLFASPLAGSLSDADAQLEIPGSSPAVGDLDADGIDDLVLRVAEGSAVVFGPPPSGVVTTAEADSLITDGTGGYTFGDLNGDGDGDLALTADGHVFVFLDVPLGTMDTGDASGTLLGSGGTNLELATADFDLDGVDDLLVGSSTPGSETSSGDVFLWYGLLSGAAELQESTFALRGVVAGDLAGVSVAGADVTGDGFPDAIVGASSTDVGGSVYVVSLQGR